MPNHGASLQSPLRLHLVVRGRVQGVGFRAWAAHAAADLGLSGYIRNHPDGDRIEAEAQGAPEAVRHFAQLLQHGPPLAHVLSVEAKPVPARPSPTAMGPSFVIRH